MDADLGALPDNIDALKAALMIERITMPAMTAERDMLTAERGGGTCRGVGRFGFDCPS